MKCSDQRIKRLIEPHFAGTISPSSERRLREHLPLCDACRARYERHLLLSELDPAGKKPKERLGRALGIESAAQPRGPRFRFWKACLVAAVVVTGLTMGSMERSASQRPLYEFAARGPSLGQVQPCQLIVYRVHENGTVSANPSTIALADRLAFAYANPQGARNLMIFAVDEYQHIYWYFPSWLQPNENPTAVPILHDSRVVELPEAIRHDYVGTELTIVGLFTNEDLAVRDVEAILTSASTGATLPRIGVGEQHEFHVSLRRP